MTLPYLGLGLSSNAQRDDAPRPFALLDAHPGLFDYLEYSAPLDVRQARAEASLFGELERRRATTPLVYHPVHLNLGGPALESPERLSLAAEHVLAVGSPWVSNDVGWWHHQGVPFPGYLYVTPRLDAEGLAHSVRHVEHVRDAMPVPLLVENPVVMTARGPMHVAEFMSKLHAATGCPLLLDVGHLFSHQLARGLSLLEGLEGLPWGAVAQLHLAGGVVTGGFYADDHPQPIRDEVWALFDELVKRCPHLRAVTYEGDGHPDVVALRVLRRLRSAVPKEAAAPPPSAPSGRRRLPAETGEDVGGEWWWTLLDELHATPNPERAYRLAVLAEALDAGVPLARAAVAPTFEALAGFLISDELRSHFRDGTRPLPDAFLQWAARRARTFEGADALVSLELWARTTAARRKSPDAFDATFPVDLTEALHAASALRRHTRGRSLESSEAWEGVLQCARRAGRGPWTVRLSPTAHGVAIHCLA